MDKFNISELKPLLPYNVAFSIDVVHGRKNIAQMMIDEGASTCVMPISFWKALGSPDLVPLNTLLTTFDGRSFHPHGILPSFKIKLTRKVVSMEI